MPQGTFFFAEPFVDKDEKYPRYRYNQVTGIDQNGKKIYPVYMIIKRFSIEFYYHQTNKEKIDDKFHSQNKKTNLKNGNNNDKTYLLHRNICFLHLPLSLNLAVKDNLTQKLKSYYKAIYKLEGNDTINLENRITYYWNLKEFYSEEADQDESYQKLIKDHFGGEEGYETNRFIFYRKLILDFLYDLEHSRVFESSPFYEESEIHLKENFFFNAIAAKASYYYYRRLYVENQDDEEVKDLYSHKLRAANQQWLHIIRMRQSCKDFWHSGGWFKNVEEEMKSVVFNRKNFRFHYFNWILNFNKREKKLDNESINELKEISSWFLERYNIFNAFKIILFTKPNYRYFLSVCILFCLLLFPFLLIDQANEIRKIPNFGYAATVAFTIYFLSGLLIFSIVFLLYYKDMLRPVIRLFLPRLIMALSSAWLIFVTSEDLLKVTFDSILFHHWFVLFLLIIPVLIFISLEIKTLAPDIFGVKIFKRVLGVLVIAFLYSILGGIFFTNITSQKILSRSGYLEVFFKEENSLGNKSHVKIPKKILKLLKKSSNSKSVIRQDDLYQNLVDTRYKKSKIRFMYEVSFPIIKRKLRIFPGMLFYNSFFVLFIGIFIQLVFENKGITESIY